jgi:hypothetical protein
MTAPPRAQRGVLGVALASFVLAFVVRLYWDTHILSPLDSEYSDMGGYVSRAEHLLAHTIPGDPRLLTTYPYGTHYILALEFLVLGRHARHAIGILHALVASVPAACAPYLVVRLVPRLWAAALAALLVALWYPQICFTGFFLSEIWFYALIAGHACFVAYGPWRTGGRIGTGVIAALAFVVRPQFLVTWGLDVASRGLRLLWRGGVVGAVRGLVWLVLPMALAIGASALRLHALAGHWGLIAESGVNRVWADTDICKLEANWSTPDGGHYGYWFSPPSKQPCSDKGTVKFEGFIADGEILNKIRLRRLRGVPWWKRLERMASNADLLIDRNLPWPESNYHDDARWRGALMDGFRIALKFVVLPFAVLGLLLGPWNATTRILAANLTTVIIAAAIFFGEARYHTPYDPFAIVLAISGLHQAVRRLGHGIEKFRYARVQRPPPTREGLGAAFAQNASPPPFAELGR